MIPVCYAVAGETVYITIDEKPKRRDVPLKRVRNILENPRFSFVVDRWDEDWSRLGWVMLRGAAEILDSGAEHDRCAGALARALSAIPDNGARRFAGARAARRKRDRLGRSVAALTRFRYREAAASLRRRVLA